LDLIPEIVGDVAFDPGKLIEAGPVVLSTGGAVANTGLSLAKLGARPALVGKIGAGIFGRAVTEAIESHGRGLADHLVIANDQPTSYTIVLNVAGRDRTFIHAPGANTEFGSEDVSDDLLRRVRWMHLGYPPLLRRMYLSDGEELESLFRRAKEAGVTTSLDLSLPDRNAESGRIDWVRILRRVLPYVDFFLPSDAELRFMLDPAGVSDLLELVKRSLDLGSGNVGIKLGDRGFILGVRTGWPDCSGRTFWHPSYRVDVAGTTGAGDAAIAGFILGCLRGFDPIRTLQAASAVGACCCESPDAVSRVLPWEKISARLDAGWKTVPLDAGPGWQPCGSGFTAF
jgi:sugar/nucleoside kinase (ribokinase family)